jgi:hypothetical protein
MGTEGRELVESHETGESAVAAMQGWRERKERRGYVG